MFMEVAQLILELKEQKEVPAVFVYYAGHGVIGELHRQVALLNADPTEKGRKHMFPIDAKCDALSKGSECLVIKMFDCCRTNLKESARPTQKDAEEENTRGNEGGKLNYITIYSASLKMVASDEATFISLLILFLSNKAA